MSDQQLIIAKTLKNEDGRTFYLKVHKDLEYPDLDIYNVEEYSWPENKLLRTSNLQNVGPSKWRDTEFGITKVSNELGKFIDDNYPIQIHLP